VHQLAHQIFDVTADVTGLAELCRVRFHKRHLDQVGDVFDQIRFADACRSNEDHVLLNVFNFLSAVRIFFLQPSEVIGVVVMIANRNREDFLRFLLFDDESVQMRFYVARQQMELEFFMVGFLQLFILLRDRWLRLGNCRN
jgi:hypothetical protein